MAWNSPILIGRGSSSSSGGGFVSTTYDLSSNPNYPATTSATVAYIVGTAGKIGGASGVALGVGDIFYRIGSGSTAAGDQAAVGSSWAVIRNANQNSSSQTITASPGTTTIDAGNKMFANRYASSNATAVTILFSNILDGAQVCIDYLKTTATNLVITFPASTVISVAGSATVSGVTATFNSTASGRFLITICNINGTYFVYINQSVA